MSNGTRGAIPHLVIDGAVAALDFYGKAFGATEVMRIPAEDGRLLHAEIKENGARVFLRDEFSEPCSEQGSKISSPKTLGGTGVTIHLPVENCDQTFERAKSAGATVVMEPWDAFWGERYAQVLDPFGHSWSFAHPVKQQG